MSTSTITSTKRHPITGAPFLPVGYRRDGRPIFPILGGAEDDGGNDDGGNDDGGNGKAGGPPAGEWVAKADVERIVTERLERDRQAADRKQQRATATEADRIAALERQLEEERTARRRTSVAARHGLTDLEDLLGSGTDEELEDRAKRLTARLSAGGGESGKGGGRGRGTGSSSRPGGANRTVREGSGTALTPKQQAVQALRGLRGGTSSADD